MRWLFIECLGVGLSTDVPGAGAWVWSWPWSWSGKDIVGNVCMFVCVCRAQWLRVELRTIDYENPVSNPGCGVKTLGNFFHFTLLQLTQLNKNEYLAIDSGGYVYEQPSCIKFSIWLDASQRSRVGVWVNRSVREVKCKARWAVLRTGYCAI